MARSFLKETSLKVCRLRTAYTALASKWRKMHMSTQFNPNKPFGTICGVFEECPQAKYEQGGKFFDIRYQEVKRGDIGAHTPAVIPVSTAPSAPVLAALAAASTPVAPAAPTAPAPVAPPTTQHVPVPDPEADALAAEIMELRIKLTEAGVKAKASPTPTNKAAVTRLTNKLKKLDV
jgi:hypothetical protein